MEQEQNAEMRKRLADEGDYYDGSLFYKKKTKGKWLDDDSIISVTR